MSDNNQVDKNFKCNICHKDGYSLRSVCPGCGGIDSYLELLPCSDPKPLTKPDNNLEWISVDKELPESGRLLVACEYDDFTEVGFRSNIDTGKHYWADFHFPVSHWMYLPVSPVSEE